MIGAALLLLCLIAIPISIAAVLAPLIVLYVSAVLTPDWKGSPWPARWEVLGIYCGAFAFVCYIPIWYSVRTVQLAVSSNLPDLYYFRSRGNAPLLDQKRILVREYFRGVAGRPARGGCFVVTAAARGHRPLTGPFFEIEHNGVRQRVNRQLDTFCNSKLSGGSGHRVPIGCSEERTTTLARASLPASLRPGGPT